MKWKFKLPVLIEKGEIVNMAQMPDYSEYADESTWQIGDDNLVFNHTTKKFRLERFEWDDEDGDWLQCTPDLDHKEARQVALDNDIIYEVM